MRVQYDPASIQVIAETESERASLSVLTRRKFWTHVVPLDPDRVARVEISLVPDLEFSQGAEDEQSETPGRVTRAGESVALQRTRAELRMARSVLRQQRHELGELQHRHDKQEAEVAEWAEAVRVLEGRH